VLVGILALLAIASILLWKFYSTLPYCTVTVVSIDVDEKAHVKLTGSTLCSSRAMEWYTYIVDGVTISSSPSRDWSSLRPLSGGFTSEFDMQLEPDHGLQSLAQKATKAIDVKVGETYQVTPDSPLLLYRLKDKDGHIHEQWIEVSK